MSLPINKNNQGQALLIVLLILSVVLTIVLSILATSISDVGLTTKEESSLRAFSAAEAGVEQVLIGGGEGQAATIGDATYSATIEEFGEGESQAVYPVRLLSGETASFWFVGHDEEGLLTCSGETCFTGDTVYFCWGKEGQASDEPGTPAVEVSFFYLATPGDYSTARIARAAYDPNSARRSLNFFQAPDAGTCTLAGEVFAFRKQMSLSDLGIPALVTSTELGLQLVKVKLLYNATTQSLGMGVNFPGNAVLPSQGVSIESLGSSGDANRKISVFQSFFEAPSIFDNVLYSGGGVAK